MRFGDAAEGGMVIEREKQVEKNISFLLCNLGKKQKKLPDLPKIYPANRRH